MSTYERQAGRLFETIEYMSSGLLLASTAADGLHDLIEQAPTNSAVLINWKRSLVKVAGLAALVR
jgi:hypothetical protein